MQTCTNCGSYLSSDYIRVCGDNDGTVSECPHCVAAERAESRWTTSGGREDAAPDSPGLVFSMSTGPEGRGAGAGSRQQTGSRGFDGPGDPVPSRPDRREPRDILASVLGVLR